MRFYLDNDVDRRCRSVLVEAGHECWATSQAGRSDAGDGDQAYYSSVKGAVIITHDREFTEWRKRNTIGRHIRLKCEQPDGPAVLKQYVDVLPPLLLSNANLVIELSPDVLRLTHGQWL